ncbi:hypothetical protein BGZ72_009778 [Mortierella alpina]|nr:hypothetical protein BGZ72_009778 [Mortierella alpina]
MTGANYSLELTPNVPSREGLVEIRVGVILPYSLPNNLTQQLAFSGTSAIRLAVSEINQNQLIPGAYLTLVLKDSFNGLDPENSGAAQAIFSTVSLLQTNGGVAGVIGDVSSALTVQSALLTSRLSIPQCSYSAGSTQLSNKDDYGSFFRTIPTELMFGGVMLDFVASRAWKTVAVFYTGDSLGSQMMDQINIQAAKRNINIGYRRSFWEQGASSDLGPALDALEDSGQRIIVVAAVGLPQIRLMLEAVKRGLVSKDYVWLAINQVTEPLLNGNSSLKPMDLNGLLMFDNLLKLHGYPPYEQFLDKWSALNPRDQAYSCMMAMAGGFANAVKGNITSLHLLAAGKLGSKLKPLSMNTNYTGPGGPMVFDENGDVLYGNFILYNFQNGKVVPIGTSYSGVFNISSPPMYFDGTYSPPADSAPLKVLNPKFGSSIGMVIISVAGLSVLFCLLTTLVVIVYRDAQVIKSSSPMFCCLELCGFILLYISTIMGLDIPTGFICMARPLALNVGFVLVVGNIVAKNFRVYRIFHNIYVTKRVIKDAHLLKIVGTILVGSLIIMVAWFLKSPPALQQITMPDFTAYWTCNSISGSSTPLLSVLFLYNASLLLIATYLGYKNRNVAANYNECRQIAFVVYNILLSACLAMPTVFLPQDQFLTKFYLSNVVILFGTTFSLMFLFLPKLWELFTQIEKSHQRGSNSGNGGTSDGSDQNSIDGFYNGAPAWMNSAGNLVLLAQGADLAGGVDPDAPGTGGVLSSINASNQHLPGGRKGSVGTLDDTKGDTAKETHMGYMGVKFQNRYLSFLSSWCMRRVILYPAGRYFTCFEVGKPETGRTFTYMTVFIHSREPGAYILRVIGCGRNDFLLQVRDEERLLYWYGLFDNTKQGNNNAYASTLGLGSIMPLGNLSTANLSLMGGPLSATLPTNQNFSSIEDNQRSTYDRVLEANRDQHQISDRDHRREGGGYSYSSHLHDQIPDHFYGHHNSDRHAYLTHQDLSSGATLTTSPGSGTSSSVTGHDRSMALAGNVCRHGYDSIEDCASCASGSGSRQSSTESTPTRAQGTSEFVQELRFQRSMVDLSELTRLEDALQGRDRCRDRPQRRGSASADNEAMELPERHGRRQQDPRIGSVDLDHEHPLQFL